MSNVCLPCKRSVFMNRSSWSSTNDLILLITGIGYFLGERFSFEALCTVETFTDKNKQKSFL